jgi:ribosomal protein L34E
MRKRSVRAKAVAGRQTKIQAYDPRRYRRPSSELIQDAARKVLTRASHHTSSQRALQQAILPLLRRNEPLSAITGRRMRMILLSTPGVRVTVRFAERAHRRPPSRCPVCATELEGIQNRTLEDGQVTLGYRCRNCGYWTHLRSRIPVRYSYQWE